MKAIVITQPGDASVLSLQEVPDAVPRSDEVVIGVTACGVNRADIRQREGLSPAPDGVPPWPGLEVSGTVVDVGGSVTRFRVGDQVCALLSGGGYAERVAVAESLVLPIPENIDVVDAAGVVEAAATVWSNVFMTGQLQAGETFLVHGGSSGIGTMAIQLAHAKGATVAVTASTQKKLDACGALGADILINYRDDDFVEVMKAHSGVDVILDSIGGPYLSRNLSSLRTGGRILCISNLSGAESEVNVNTMMAKRATIAAASLRARSAAYKAALVAELRDKVWPMLEAGTVRPIIHTRFPLSEAAAAHRLMESSTHFGKIVLTV